MLVRFLAVLRKESLPASWRRPRPPKAINAVRLKTFGDDAHTHVVDVWCTDGVVRPVREVIFGLRYRHEVYVTASAHGDPINIMVSRCRMCDEEVLSAGPDDTLLSALHRF